MTPIIFGFLTFENEMVMMKTPCEYVTGDNPSRQNQTTKPHKPHLRPSSSPSFPMCMYCVMCTRMYTCMNVYVRTQVYMSKTASQTKSIFQFPEIGLTASSETIPRLI